MNLNNVRHWVRYALIAALAITAARPALAACSNETLKGTYGLDGSGTIFVPGLPVSGPFVRVGAVRFDGKGGVRYTTVSSYNGIVTDEPYEGAYTVSPDCRFVYQAVLPPPLNVPATFAGFISANGDRVDYMLVDPPGAAVQATLFRQPKETCQTRDLFGTYAMTSDGVLLAPNPDAGSFLRVGIMTASGDAHQSVGTFTIEATANYSGESRSESFSGTYSVQPDCMVRFEYEQPSPAGHVASSFSGVLVDGDKQVIFMISTPSVVVRGTMTRQTPATQVRRN